MTGQTIIKAEGLGKRYLIGHASSAGQTETFREALVSGAKGILRSARNMARMRQLVAGDEVEEFWALREVNLEIKRGEVVGIIGRNGAGKSTLLKIMSRITEPTEGSLRIDGRLASLLEVGTGFHPELTGRENIFLNGAIMGMSQAEVRSKLDQIIDFAGVEKFIDTPVKRYSSGMYVRLAFAVAAHLDPDIMIVDEVLAVGDSEFQRKCLGKMGDIAHDGRTVILVSHNMTSIQALCDRAILMQEGRLISSGPTDQIVSAYLDRNLQANASGLASRKDRSGMGDFRFESLKISGTKESQVPITGNGLNIEFEISGPEDSKLLSSRIGISFYNRYGELLFNCATDAGSNEPIYVGGRSSRLCLEISRLPLSCGEYSISLFLERNSQIEDFIEMADKFTVEDAPYFGTSRNVPPGWEGKSVLVDHTWQKIR